MSEYNSDDKHEVIDEVESHGHQIWTAYVPEALRFINPLPYATVVFNEEGETVNERFAESREEALVNQTDALFEVGNGTLEVQDLDQSPDLTPEQTESANRYIAQQLAEGMTERIFEQLQSGVEHHPDCDGKCQEDAGQEEMPGQYL